MRLVHAAFEDARRHLGREAAGEADDPLAVLPEHLHVHARLVVEAFEEAAGGELHEVLVALGGAGEERQMVVLGPTPIVPIRGDVDLAAHYGFYTGLLRLPVEFDGAVHHTMVGEGEAGHILVLGEGDEVPDPAGPVQH